MDTKTFKRTLQKSERYHRRSFGHAEEVKDTLETAYQSDLVAELRASDYVLTRGDVTVRLAEAFGFCWGVERAVAIAYETRTHFPNERIWITNEIIHNPGVNDRLREMNVGFIEVHDGEKDFSVVDSGDVVILPAFGATVQEMKLLDERGCTIVDTTCPWVSKVWNSVEKHKKKSYTSIVHGKYKHEETLATTSFAGKYLVVLNLDEAQYVADYILKDGDREEFLAKFANAYSEGFDPDTDLARVGVANQTTMLKTETEAIGKLLERTMLAKHGPLLLNEHFSAFNTICDATQERQDAMLDLVDRDDIDLILVIGGFNSSNTTHLQEMAIERGIPSFHIDSSDRIGLDNTIEHKPLGSDMMTTSDWLPEGKLTIGVTSGASTPDKSVETSIEKILAIKSAAVPV